MLEGQRLAIGRDPGQQGLTLDDGRTSRVHTELSFVPEYGVYRVADAGSKNGTFLNGRRIESDYLQAGAVLRIGDTLLAYSEVAAGAAPIDGWPPDI
jgi:pSer/pThr/pTyr-binding forkhead associated (FHA) protein